MNCSYVTSIFCCFAY